MLFQLIITITSLFSSPLLQRHDYATVAVGNQAVSILLYIVNDLCLLFLLTPAFGHFFCSLTQMKTHFWTPIFITRTVFRDSASSKEPLARIQDEHECTYKCLKHE